MVCYELIHITSSIPWFHLKEKNSQSFNYAYLFFILDSIKNMICLLLNKNRKLTKSDFTYIRTLSIILLLFYFYKDLLFSFSLTI